MKNIIWGILILCVSGVVYAYTPLFTTHDTFTKVDAEFNQIENDLQSQQFTVYNATPILSVLKDGQIVIVSSNTWSCLMYRYNQEVYKVIGSCVTVFR